MQGHYNWGGHSEATVEARYRSRNLGLTARVPLSKAGKADSIKLTGAMDSRSVRAVGNIAHLIKENRAPLKVKNDGKLNEPPSTRIPRPYERVPIRIIDLRLPCRKDRSIRNYSHYMKYRESSQCNLTEGITLKVDSRLFNLG